MSTTPFDNIESLEAEAAKLEAEANEPGTSENVTVDGNEVEKLRAERDALYEKLARAQAEFQNSRKRLEAEFDQRLGFANSSLIKSLLPVIDNFERALAVDPAKGDTATVLKGLQLVHDQWIGVLKQQNVEVVIPAAGDAFDPALHQAVMQQESETIEPGKITQLFQNGYQLQGRVIRPAAVAVAKSQ